MPSEGQDIVLKKLGYFLLAVFAFVDLEFFSFFAPSERQDIVLQKLHCDLFRIWGSIVRYLLSLVCVLPIVLVGCWLFWDIVLIRGAHPQRYGLPPEDRRGTRWWLASVAGSRWWRKRHGTSCAIGRGLRYRRKSSGPASGSLPWAAGPHVVVPRLLERKLHVLVVLAELLKKKDIVLLGCFVVWRSYLVVLVAVGLCGCLITPRPLVTST